MSRKLALAAVTMTAGLFAVGCGPTTTSGGSASNPTSDAAKRAKEVAENKAAELKHGGADAARDAGKKLDEAKDKAAGALDAGLKEAMDKLEKELPPIEAKIGEYKKQMETAGDAAKIKAATDIYQPAVGKLDEIKKMIADNFTVEKGKELLAGGGEAMKKLVAQITEKIDALKKMLGM